MAFPSQVRRVDAIATHCGERRPESTAGEAISGTRVSRLVLAMAAAVVLLTANQLPAQDAAAPFQLTPQQQAEVDQILAMWEKASNQIKTFKCDFERWDYDPVFGPGGDVPMTKNTGEISYAQPDKGLYRINEIRRYNPDAQEWEVQSEEPGEHWVCDGEAVYEFDGKKKQLIVRKLPAHLQGKAIADGPLPFLFGAEAAKLKARYFIRISEITPNQIWLEVFPRWQRDAADFQRVELILDRTEFLPTALRVHQPNGKNRTVYMFEAANAQVNNPLAKIINFFRPPIAPLGWQKIIEEVPQAPPAAAPSNDQARRAPAGSPQR